MLVKVWESHPLPALIKILGLRRQDVAKATGQQLHLVGPGVRLKKTDVKNNNRILCG